MLSACLALALCLGLLPVTALAAAPSGQVLYVGGVPISTTGYWTMDSDGNVIPPTEGGTPSNNYIHYDADDNTLTLHNATIKMNWVTVIVLKVAHTSMVRPLACSIRTAMRS